MKKILVILMCSLIIMSALVSCKAEPDTFNVKLNLDGGTCTALTQYTAGTAVKLPTDAKKADYTFGGWFDNKDLKGTAVTEIKETDTGDKEFWAKWNIQDIKIETMTITNNIGSLKAGSYYCNKTDYSEETVFYSDEACKTSPVFKLAGFSYDNGKFKTSMTAVSKEVSSLALTLTPEPADAVVLTESGYNITKKAILKDDVVKIAFELKADTTYKMTVIDNSKATINLNADWVNGTNVILKAGTYYSDAEDFTVETTFYSDKSCKTAAFKLGAGTANSNFYKAKLKKDANEVALSFMKDSTSFNFAEDSTTGITTIQGNSSKDKTVSNVKFTISFTKAGTTYKLANPVYIGKVTILTGFKFGNAQGSSASTPSPLPNTFYIKKDVNTDNVFTGTSTETFRESTQSTDNKQYSGAVKLYSGKSCEDSSNYVVFFCQSDNGFVLKLGNFASGWKSSEITSATPGCSVANNQFTPTKFTTITFNNCGTWGAGSCTMEFNSDVVFNLIPQPQ